MLEVPDLGKDRWNIVRNLSECFLGTRPKGETWKFSNGGEGKGPAVRPFATSSAKFEVTTSGLREAVGKFLEKRNCLGPE